MPYTDKILPGASGSDCCSHWIHMLCKTGYYYVCLKNSMHFYSGTFCIWLRASLHTWTNSLDGGWVSIANIPVGLESWFIHFNSAQCN